MTAICHACGKQWPRHPVLEVGCPQCYANVGMGCSRPSGHAGPLIEPHIEREQRAVDEGVLELCSEGPTRKARSTQPGHPSEKEGQLALL